MKKQNTKNDNDNRVTKKRGIQKNTRKYFMLQKTYLYLLALMLLGLVPGNTSAQAGKTSFVPAKGRLIYQNALASQKAVEDWVMEGPGRLDFKNGWMEMHSPGEKWHHVFWCPYIFPSRFIAEWEVKVLQPEGLLIVFFAATGNKGQSIFARNLPKRDGTFRYYNRGEINCYHISYYANNPKHPDRGDTHLRKDPDAILLANGTEGIPVGSFSTHHVKLIKDEGHIMMFVDNRKIMDYTDDGKKYGPVNTLGYIGFRQMRWSDCAYRNFKVWEIVCN